MTFGAEMMIVPPFLRESLQYIFSWEKSLRFLLLMTGKKCVFLLNMRNSRLMGVFIMPCSDVFRLIERDIMAS